MTPMTRIFLWFLATSWLLAGSSFGQDAATEVGTQLVGQANAVAQDAAGTFRAALAGDPEALTKLGVKYLIPAAIALLTLIIGYMAASFLGRVVGSTLAARLDPTLGQFVGNLVKTAVLVLVTLSTLGYFGVDVTSFAAILAAAGFAVGMALQGTLSNFAAGIMLLVFRPFKLGDYVRVADNEGTVDTIDLFTTRLNTLDNRHLILPNSEVFGVAIENFTHNAVRRVNVDVGVEYAADVDHTRDVLERAVMAIPGAVLSPPPQVYLCNLGDSSVNWQLRVWCRPADYWEVREQLTRSAKRSLDAAGISIPFPQIDVHVQNPEVTLRAVA